ncbi:hypothetical protein MAPG_09729 [Magnaporthiopsis poae ATCC 64411]|uniref:Uncharacterized protein n=1 Tax=Magnaporthiopsis poae (strain ATCC 64411 / 73-15) TaxID=644358 RepID=A0A0C4EAQ2_MAGP6|nr:hypothetical protein MAPG_09729 [Magnaporthiopsis poae ATCC 64411]
MQLLIAPSLLPSNMEGCFQAGLAEPLLALDEIEAVKTTLPSLYPPSDKRVIVVRGLFAPKYGKSLFVNSNEGHILLLLLRGRIQGLPAPRLQPLDSLRDDMLEDEKTDAMDQLDNASARLRGLPSSSPPLFGSIAGGSVPHRFFHSQTRSPDITGSSCDEVDYRDAKEASAQGTEGDRSQEPGIP